MMSNFFENYFASQKAMFDAWQKHMASTYGKKEGNTEGEAPNMAEFYQKMFDAPNDFWRKVSDSYKSYHAVFELWKQLSESATPLDSQAAGQLYDAWFKQNFSLIRSNLLPSLPESMRHFTERFFDSMETSGEALAESMKTWGANGEALSAAFQDALNKGPKGYIEFLETWQKSYDATFGKFLNAPTFGKDMDFWKHQKSSFDRFVKFNTAAAQFYGSLFEIAQDATRQVLEDYAAMQAQGTQPKTFDEFYKYWAKTVTSAYEKVLLSENLSVLSGNMVDAMSRFKQEYDKLCAFYLANVPVPKKSDMEDVYRTVYELKKELRALKKEMSTHEHRNA